MNRICIYEKVKLCLIKGYISADLRNEYGQGTVKEIVRDYYGYILYLVKWENGSELYMCETDIEKDGVDFQNWSDRLPRSGCQPV